MGLCRQDWLGVRTREVRHGGQGGAGARAAVLRVPEEHGAHAVQLVSSLLNNGPQHLQTLREGVAKWLEVHEYESLEQARGSMNFERAPSALQYERANYAEILLSWD